MSVPEQIAELESRGFTLRADGESLWVEPRPLLSKEDVTWIKAQKDAILLELVKEAAVDAYVAEFPDSTAGKPVNLTLENGTVLEGRLLDLVVVTAEGFPTLAFPAEEWEQAVAYVTEHNRQSQERLEKSQHRTPKGKGKKGKESKK